MALTEKSDEEVTDVVEVDDTVTETETEEPETDETSGDDESEEEEERELEPWELTGEEDETLPDVPVKIHIKAKEKWKRQKSTLKDENETLKAENESLRAGANRTVSTELKRPDPMDFDDDDQYEDAKDEYLIQKIRLEDQQKNVTAQQKAFNERIEHGANKHYERVSKFVKERDIDDDVYKAAEQAVVDTIEDVFPGRGEKNVEFYLSKLGEGSDKTIYFLGRNKAKLKEFKTLLEEDHTGVSPGMFLSAENARLRGVATGKPKSNAPKPAATATGDTATKVPANAGNLEKKYNDALKKGQDAKAFDIKYDAKRVHKIDTNKW